MAQELVRRQMDHAVQGDWGHDMDEETGHFVQGVEDERVAPHDDGHGIVSIGQTVGADEEPFRLREAPDREQQEEVDKIAQVSEKVVVSLLTVGDESNGHEV